VTALRPGELFAVRWKDLEPGRIRIDEAVYRNKLGDPKTATSVGYVYVSKSLELELAMWKEFRPRTAPTISYLKRDIVVGRWTGAPTSADSSVPWPRA